MGKPIHLLAKLTVKIVAKSSTNKMNSFNLSVVFGPTLLHDSKISYSDSAATNFICQTFIDHFPEIFTVSLTVICCNFLH